MALAVARRAGASRWLVAAVVVALLGEVAVAAVPWLSDVASGRTDWRSLLAAAGLFWLFALVGMVWYLVRRFRNVDESLRDEAERFALTAAISGEWLWQASPELVLTYCSPAVADMLGYEAAELLGRSIFDLIDPAEVPRTHAILASALAQGNGWEDVEVWWCRADGERVQLRGTAVPMQDRQGRLIGFQGVRRHADDATASARLRELRRRIDDTLANRRLTIALQPIVDLATGELFSCEALARFPDDGGPAQWFADAHKIGKGVELELEAACRVVELLDRLPGERIGINASPALVVDARFHELLGRRGVAQRVTIEITEHAHVANYTAINRVLADLRSRGLRLSVDDTGAGYASFSHVLELKPDSIKIDRSWLAEIDRDPARRALCTAARSLAASLGAVVIAEGIETESQLDAVTRLGISHIQGFLLARPSTDPNEWARWRDRTWQHLPLAS